MSADAPLTAKKNILPGNILCHQKSSLEGSVPGQKWEIMIFLDQQLSGLQQGYPSATAVICSGLETY